MTKTSLVAEVGVNHGGDIERAIRLIRMAAEAGAEFVKFQKRDVEISTPKNMWNVPKDTPWGTVEPYIEYRRKAEFGRSEYNRIDTECSELGIRWFASAWDKPSVEFLAEYDTPFIKIPSALAVDIGLIEYALRRNNVIVSTGMCTLGEVDDIAAVLPPNQGNMLFVCHSEYPTSDEREINLNQIVTYRSRYPGIGIGFSSHADNPYPAIYAGVLKAEMVEVHISESRSYQWGDNSASLERKGLELVARELKRINNILGNGEKRLYPSELPARKKLRGV